MEQLKTVNVIEYCETINRITSYPDTQQGNIAAEELFIACVKENSEDVVSDGDMSCYLEEGIYTDNSGYELYIAHSE